MAELLLDLWMSHNDQNWHQIIFQTNGTIIAFVEVLIERLYVDGTLVDTQDMTERPNLNSGSEIG